MARKNIFEILNEKVNIDEEINKIKRLVVEATIEDSMCAYNIECFVDEFCLHDWKQRGRYLSCEEIKGALELEAFEQMDGYYTDEEILIYLEYLCNLVWLCNQYISEHRYYRTSLEYVYLYENMASIVDSFNYEIREFSDDEKVLLVEKNAAATAVAEIVESDVAYEVIEYNHHLLKGDIGRKQKILKVLADKIEPMRGELKKIDKELENNVGYLLNKMNIRHNNVEGKNAIEYVKNLSEEELEVWYDETYQMLLLCILEYDNIDRNRKIADLKKIIEQ